MKPLVVVTGASSGIGAATAKLFSQNGHPTLLLARRVELLKKMNLPNSMCVELDVQDVKGFKNAVENAEKDFGPADCLVNNAGVMLLGNYQNQDANEWRKMLDVNVMGVLNGVQSVITGMTERNHGTILNVSSVAGRKTFPNHGVYCGTKFAVHAISESLREEVSDFNVRVCTIAPGAVETELLGHTTDKNIINGYQQWKEDMGGVISSENIAETIWFAYSQPQSVCVREIVVAPTRQQP